MALQKIIQDTFAKSVEGLEKIISKDNSQWYPHIVGLPEKLQIVYTVMIFNNQVMTGGLHQYFFNGHGQFGYLTVDNLETIEAGQAAAILRKALTAVNKENYPIPEFREKILNRKLDRITNFEGETSDTLDELTDQYFAIMNEDIERLLAEYLKKQKFNAQE